MLTPTKPPFCYAPLLEGASGIYHLRLKQHPYIFILKTSGKHIWGRV